MVAGYHRGSDDGWMKLEYEQHNECTITTWFLDYYLRIPYRSRVNVQRRERVRQAHAVVSSSQCLHGSTVDDAGLSFGVAGTGRPHHYIFSCAIQSGAVHYRSLETYETITLLYEQLSLKLPAPQYQEA